MGIQLRKTGLKDQADKAQKQGPMCRQCKETPETIQHIRMGSKRLAGKNNVEPHGQAAGNMHGDICTELGWELLRPR